MRTEQALSQWLIRALILTAALLCVGFSRVAGEPLYVIEIVVVAFAGKCAVHPDSHVGLLVVLAVGINWVVAVEDATNPWVIGVAASLALFHTSVAAASVAPLGAAWTPTLGRKWGGRLAAIAFLSLPTWLIVHAIEQRGIEPHPLLFIGALVALTLTALRLGPNVTRIRYLQQ